MCLSKFNQRIWIGYLEKTTSEQVKVKRQCQSAGQKATINYAAFFSATVCRNWKLHAPNV